MQHTLHVIDYCLFLRGRVLTNKQLRVVQVAGFVFLSLPFSTGCVLALPSLPSFLYLPKRESQDQKLQGLSYN